MLNLNLNSISVFRGGPAGPSYDPDAQAFFDATGLADPTQMTLINTMVLELKAHGIWSDLKALYPFAGNTANMQKYNLKDPRDLDAAFRLEFNGGWTHTPGNAAPNGVNAFADTFLNPVTHLTNARNLYYGFYLNQYWSPGAGGDTFGVSVNNPPKYRMALWQDGGNMNTYWEVGNGGVFLPGFAPVTTGLFSFNRKNNGDYELTANGTDFQTGNDGAMTVSTSGSMFIGTYNGPGNNYTNAHFGAVVIVNNHLNATKKGQMKSILDAWQAGL